MGGYEVLIQDADESLCGRCYRFVGLDYVTPLFACQLFNDIVAMGGKPDLNYTAKHAAAKQCLAMMLTLPLPLEQAAFIEYFNNAKDAVKQLLPYVR